MWLCEWLVVGHVGDVLHLCHLGLCLLLLVNL